MDHKHANQISLKLYKRSKGISACWTWLDSKVWWHILNRTCLNSVVVCLQTAQPQLVKVPFHQHCISILIVFMCPLLSTIHSGYHCSSDPVQVQSLEPKLHDLPFFLICTNFLCVNVAKKLNLFYAPSSSVLCWANLLRICWCSSAIRACQLSN